MERGRTLKNGGCRYDVISQSNIGPAVVGNSLEVIRRLIYEEKKITWRQLKAALASDWSGTEGEQLRRLVLQQPKFGNDEDGVDEIVRAVFDSYLELLPSYHTVRTGSGPRLSCYTMSTSNITSYVPNGMIGRAHPAGGGQIQRRPFRLRSGKFRKAGFRHGLLHAMLAGRGYAPADKGVLAAVRQVAAAAFQVGGDFRCRFNTQHGADHDERQGAR